VILKRDEIVRRLTTIDGPLACPSREAAPVFRQPWEAKAFALVVQMHSKGYFTWKEWVEHLSSVITEESARDPEDDGSRYYYHWLKACERMLEAKSISSSFEISEREALISREVHHVHVDR
jgi:nitrile hydratase accessory protein